MRASTASHRCALPVTVASEPGNRFVCPICGRTWIYSPFQRIWRYVLTPGSMVLRWAITALTFRQIELIRVGWRKRSSLNWGIAIHWLIVALNSLAAGAIVLW